MKNNQVPSRIDFDSWQESFVEKMRLANKSESGIVKEGLNLTLEGNTIKCSSGSGFYPSGDELVLYYEEEENIESLDKNYFIYLVLENDDIEKVTVRDCFREVYSGYKELHRETYLHVTEEDNIKEDPYTHELFSTFSSDKSKNRLIIGLIKDGEVHPLNRAYQIPNLPINGVALYFGKFIPYITLKGCEVATDLLEKFIKFQSVPGVKGGNSEFNIEAKHIPSLGWFSGTTEEAGLHSHKIPSYGYLNDDYEPGLSETWWTGLVWSYTERSPHHNHNIKKANFYNYSQVKIKVEPPYRTLIPIRRKK